MNLLLRPWSQLDAPALQRAAATSADLDNQLGGNDLSTLARAEAFIARSLIFSAETKNWAIVTDGVAVVNVGLTAIEYRHDTAWVFYWLASSARGKGYVTAGLQAVCDWAFSAGLYRLELGHRVNNPESCRVASAAGFRSEGIEREKLRYGDERFDVETHARLAHDEAHSPSGL